MQCDYCQQDGACDAQYAVGSTGFICDSCAKQHDMVITPNHVWGGESYVPRDWCARSKGLRKTCPEGIKYCGASPMCNIPETNVSLT